MAIRVAFEFNFEFEVKASAKEVFDVLSDIPTAASFFPGVEKLIDRGDGVFHWEIARIGTEKVNVQTVYASKYVANRRSGTIIWTPIESEGNAQFSGQWKVTRDKTKKSTHVRLQTKGIQNVPLPKIMKVLVQPIVTTENELLIKYYIHNLTKRFGGEA